jgi:pimeloyl-ACP methyl ester carboxylesterase
MPIIKIKGKDVHVQEINKEAAEPVLMVHGMLGNLAVWYFHIAPVLARHFHVIMYDLKSHGMSEKVTDGYDLHSMAGDLLSLMDVLQLPPVHLVGYSYGGLVALKTAIRFPGKIKKLSVIEGPDPGDQGPLAMMAAYSKEALRDYTTGMTEAPGRIMGKRQLDRNHRMYEFLFRETSIRADMYRERDFFYRNEIDTIPHKTLLIYGKDSDCVPAGRQLSHKIKDSRLLVMKGDHNVPVQEPRIIAHELKDFFIN